MKEMEAIVNRGRTVDSVVNPKKYSPFSKIKDGNAFDTAWTDNQDWIFANVAHAAYLDHSDLKELFDGFGADVRFYESEDKQGVIRGREAFLAIWGDKAILSFRGTEADDRLEIRLNREGFILKALRWLSGGMFPSKFRIPLIPTDIVDDLAFKSHTYKEDSGESQVHGGFFKATNELWPEILKDLEELPQPVKQQLFVTGHSLGAAMAVIAAMFYSFKKVVTFGEPSVGNNIENTIESSCAHIRYVNGNDPVTKIVPSFLFEHHGVLREIVDIDGPNLIFDHSIVNYASILESD